MFLNLIWRTYEYVTKSPVPQFIIHKLLLPTCTLVGFGSICLVLSEPWRREEAEEDDFDKAMKNIEIIIEKPPGLDPNMTIIRVQRARNKKQNTEIPRININ